MKLCWASEYWSVGNTYGYSVFANNFKKHVSPFVDFDMQADVSIAICPADKFNYIDGKFNVLFTMWESQELPKSYIEKINEADALVVPCHFVKNLFKRYTPKPIYVAHAGVDTDKFSYKDRYFNIGQEPFKILWLGAPNPRKGYLTVLKMIERLERYPNVHFYLKTTVPKVKYSEFNENIHNMDYINQDTKIKTIAESRYIQERLDKMGMGQIETLHGQVKILGKHNNITVDMRDLPVDDLVKLYHDNHCFLFPSMGEGWGMTLSEAMSTGMPCIATSMTGTADFFDKKVGYPIDYRFQKIEFRNYDFESNVCVAKPSHTFHQLNEVHLNYKQALNRGKKARKRLVENFSWEQSGRRLFEILKRFENKKLRVA